MRKYTGPVLTIILLLFTFHLSAQSENSPAKIKQEVKTVVDAYWEAFNQCDVEGLMDLESEDMEFYHDQAGIIIGARDSRESWKTMCRGEWSVRAEQTSDVDIDLMYSGGSLYGAVISGNLRFFKKYKDEEEKLAEKSEYTTLLKYENQKWFMHRIFSYAHETVEY